MALEDQVLAAAIGGGLGALAGIGLILASAVFIFLYVYTAFVLLTIAKKTHVKPLWLAWVPVANVLILLKVAKLHWAWIFALLIPAIPLGKFLLMAGIVYVWWKVCKTLRKPEWLAILMIIPIVNLFAMGYVAWGK